MNSVHLRARFFRAIIVAVAVSYAFLRGPAIAEPFAYVANYNSDDVSVVDTVTLSVVDSILVGNGPFQIAATPSGDFVYVANRLGQSVSVIETATNSVIATVIVGNLPMGVAITSDGTLAYVSNFSSDTVSAIDTATNVVVATISVFDEPRNIAFTPDGVFAYVTSDQGDIAVIDTTTNTVVDSVVFDPGSTGGIAFSPDGTFAYVAYGGQLEGVSIIDTATNTVIAEVDPGGTSPFGLAITPDGGFIYLTNRASNNVSVIDTSTNTHVATIATTGPAGITIAPDGSKAYVTNFTQDTVSIIDTATYTVTATFAVGDGPYSVALPGPVLSDLIALGDSFLRNGAKDRNEGANPMLRIRSSGKNRSLVKFDEQEISNFGPVTKATLRVTIRDIGNNWGDGRTVDAHALLADFAEGNGKSAGVPNSESTRGTGEGTTWKCAMDTDISNQQTNCDPIWLGGDFIPATAPGQIHTSGQSGVVDWDVTADVWNGYNAWLIKKTEEGQNGIVEYYSTEGADSEGDQTLAPTLILE